MLRISRRPSTAVLIHNGAAEFEERMQDWEHVGELMQARYVGVGHCSGLCEVVHVGRTRVSRNCGFRLWR